MTHSWFEDWPKYEGAAVVTLDDGHALRGTGKAELDPLGHLTLDVEADPSQAASHDELDTLRLLLGGDSVESDGVRVTPLMASPRPTESIRIETEEGVLEALSEVHCGISIGETTRVRAQPLRTNFACRGSRRAADWVVPLVNFLSKFRPHDAATARHPLRLRQFDSEYPGDGARKQDQKWLSDTSRNRLIPFECFGGPAFIEPLPDYADREHSLLNGDARSAITAVMAGPLPEQPVEHIDPFSWVPLDLVMPLSMASGIEVRPAWVELRDEDGDLVQRTHSQGFPCFAKGYSFIDEWVHRGTGRLLTGWMDVAHGKRDGLVAATRNIVLSGHYSSHTLDEGMRHAAVAVEMLCKDLGVKTTPSLSDRRTSKRLHAAIDCACATAEALAESADAQGDLETRDAVHWVVRQLSGCKGPRPNFGASVVALIRHLGFQDAEIMCEGYAQAPWRKRQKTWEALLSAYRGKAMHGGLLSLEDKSEIDIVYHTTNHLRDVVVRAILKELGYRMTYQPSLIVGTAREQLDWVANRHSMSDLGYDIDTSAAI